MPAYPKPSPLEVSEKPVSVFSFSPLTSRLQQQAREPVQEPHRCQLIPMVKLKLPKEGKKPPSSELPGATEASQLGKASRGLYTELCPLQGVFPPRFQGAPPSLSESLFYSGRPAGSR